MRRLLLAAALAMASLATPETRADGPPVTFPVIVDVVGSGEILLLVTDGSTRPCDSSDNRVLFKDAAKAGDQIKLVSATGAVCVDHTYGEFRQSQWAGANIWSAGRRGRSGGSRPAQVELEGTVSTEVP